MEAANRADATIARVQVFHHTCPLPLRLVGRVTPGPSPNLSLLPLQMSSLEDAARAARSEAAANAARSTLNEAAGDFNRRIGQWEAPSNSPGGLLFPSLEI